MQRVFVATVALGALAGIQLFFLTEDTERFFAWTINSPLTAAFLGACYWASVPLVALCSRQRLWARARIGFPAVLTLLVVLLGVTLRHLDRFHMDSYTGWTWLAVYVLLPPIMLAVLAGQLRVPGGDPPRVARMSGGLRGVLWLQATVMVALGAGLLLFPATVGPWWPWTLTTLTARAVGGWLFAIGVTTIHSTLEDDWRRLRPPFVSYTALAVLQFVALARYGEEVDWDHAKGWLYAAFLASVLALGAYGWRRSSE